MTLFHAIEDPAFMQQIGAAIKVVCPSPLEITYIEHGADNFVAIADHKYVFRFPKSDDAYKRLYFETALLQKLSHRIEAVAIPELIHVNTNPFFSVANYVNGEHLNESQISRLSEAQQAAIGQQLATFITQFMQTISGLEIKRLRTASGADNLEESWEVYFNRLFMLQPLPNSKLQPIIAQHYAQWLRNVSAEQRTYAIHDDLHLSNILFAESRLSGIVDFGDAKTGGVEEEMRWFYAMGDPILRGAIEHYRELTGVLANYDHIKEWAIMHELSSYVAHLNKQDTQAHAFLRAQSHLRSWIPGFPL